ncbi:chorismate pyruvate-lyase family protein [Agaribacterium sp. ZY112]|uniref:chorismate--pyruvate lyase family protein n=1 Tax=Agaribacterium sp. ZY112 TaxID=3233574 RepID=UPI00352463BB
MIDRFSSSGYVGFDVLQLASGESLNLRQLPAFLRVLLTTDGTVTKILESYFWEPVNVNRLAQRRLLLDCKSNNLNLNAGDEVIERRVSLSGGKSTRLYALARSLLNPEALPANVVKELEGEQVGIGEVLRESGLETYRELLSISQDGTNISRTYRILLAGKPCMEICENFPLEIYKQN